MNNHVYIGVGSNIGNRKQNIEAAIEALNLHDCIEVVEVSNWIETKAVSKTPQPDFLNGAICINTILSPTELLDVLEAIEQAGGRQSKGLGDPRPIDLDILLYGDEIVCDDRLTIPHAMLHERAFVIEPLFQIAPDLVHPILGQSMAQLKAEVVGY